MKIIVGNFKMNLLYPDIQDYLEKVGDLKNKNVIYAPSNIYLKSFVDKNLNVCSQDVSFKEKGAFTGDISALQLASIGVKYCLVGHSERRIYYDDSKKTNEKVKVLIENNIIPILCIGEFKEERENKETFNVLMKEIDESFVNIDENNLKNVIIAYEPVWSIGTGLIPTNEEILETISFIKKYVYEHYNFNIQVLYGGSVNNDNIGTINKIPIIDGYLVGGCSLNPLKFIKLIDYLK